MKNKAFNWIAGTIFLMIGILHLLRLILLWEFTLGPMHFPMWFSWFGTAMGLILGTWSYRNAFEKDL